MQTRSMTRAIKKQQEEQEQEQKIHQQQQQQPHIHTTYPIEPTSILSVGLPCVIS
jgi:hypothetical protein